MPSSDALPFTKSGAVCGLRTFAYDADPSGRWQAGTSYKLYVCEDPDSMSEPTVVKIDADQLLEIHRAGGFGCFVQLSGYARANNNKLEQDARPNYDGSLTILAPAPKLESVG